LIGEFKFILLTVYGFFKELIILRTYFITPFDRLEIGRFGVEKKRVRLHCAGIATSGRRCGLVPEGQASTDRIEPCDEPNSKCDGKCDSKSSRKFVGQRGRRYPAERTTAEITIEFISISVKRPPAGPFTFERARADTLLTFTEPSVSFSRTGIDS